jgi:hypothetical protein
VLYVRFFKEGCDRFENIYVAPLAIVESGGIDQNDTTAIQIERAGGLNRIRARSEPFTNSKIGSADEIYELFKP